MKDLEWAIRHEMACRHTDICHPTPASAVNRDRAELHLIDAMQDEIEAIKRNRTLRHQQSGCLIQ